MLERDRESGVVSRGEDGPAEGPGHALRRRGFRLAAAVAALGGVAHLAVVTARGDDPVESSASSAVRWRRIPAPRGEILDRDGVSLARSRLGFAIYANPDLYTPEVRARLIDLLELGDEEVAEMDARAERLGLEPGRAIALLDDQPRRRAALVEGADLGGAVEVQADSRRVYPRGRLAAHVIGHVSEVLHAEASSVDGADEGSQVGRRGIEAAYERLLRGGPGLERFVLDGAGRRVADEEVEALLDAPRYVSPRPGQDVQLTIDLELQRLAERAVAEHASAAVVAVEVDTGRILALVSSPSLDPNVLGGHLAASELQRAGGDPLRPDVNRAIERSYPPASTFKLITAVAGLESGAVTLTDEVTCTGQRTVGRRVLRDMGSHGAVDFVRGVQRSCNVYFWSVGERVGLEGLVRTAREFGFGVPTGIGIGEEVAGEIPDVTTLSNDRRLMTTLQTSIGGGAVRVTVLQLAMAYAALANGGRLYAPQLVLRVGDRDGGPDREPVLVRRVAVWPATLDVIRQGMWRVVNEEGGTAFAGAHGSVPMAGKTGTAPVPGAASNGDSITHAWFAGWAPWDRPEIAVVVMIESGGVGGKVAAPVARAIVDRHFAARSRPKRRR